MAALRKKAAVPDRMENLLFMDYIAIWNNSCENYRNTDRGCEKYIEKSKN
jgi:hypothetical protein